METVKKSNTALKIIRRTSIILAVSLLLIVIALYGIMFVIVKGPSENAKKLFVMTVKETSAGGFLAHLYLSSDEISDILSEKSATEQFEQSGGNTTDTSLIKIPTDTTDNKVPTDESDLPNTTTPPETSQPPQSSQFDYDENGVAVCEINGGTFNGMMMVIKNPKQVILGTPDEYGEEHSGLSLRKMMDKYGALGGINAGGFYDPNGYGTGGIPTGIVIRDGEIVWGSAGASYSIVGLDDNGILHVGSMSGQHAIDVGVKNAVSFGPALIINGEPCNSSYALSGGINPRTAIGQRADGAILMLVINGRSFSSLGATLDDLVEVMLSFGAINASNLDGGASSLMMYNGETLNNSAYIYGERILASAFLVK